jgi:hypothetical protein
MSTYNNHTGNSNIRYANSVVTTSSFTPLSLLQLRDVTTNKPVLEIKNDGEIVLHVAQKPVIKSFLKNLQSTFDLDKVKTRVAERFFVMGMQRALTMTKNKTYEEFIAHLEKEVQTRQEKVVYKILQESE